MRLSNLQTMDRLYAFCPDLTAGIGGTPLFLPDFPATACGQEPADMARRRMPTYLRRLRPRGRLRCGTDIQPCPAPAPASRPPGLSLMKLTGLSFTGCLSRRG